MSGVEPPRAEKREKTLAIHGDRRIDEYHWLRDQNDPEVIRYLEAENVHTLAQMAHTEPLQRELYDEMVGRIKETDLTVPYPEGGYLHYSRTEQGLQYRIHCRRRGSVDADEELILDANELAGNSEFFRLGVLRISPDQTKLAWSSDLEGDERYTLRFRDLKTGRDFEESIANTDDSVAWASDNSTLFYTVLDDAHRPYQVFRHQLGDDPAADELVLEEEDERFFVGLSRTRSGSFVSISLKSKITCEVLVIPADDPRAKPRVVRARVQGVEYDVEHHGDRFFILTNEEAVNFKLMAVPVDDSASASWEEIVPHRDDVMLSDVDAFQGHLVLHQRERGLPTIHVRRLSDGAEHSIDFAEPAYVVSPLENREFETRTLRFQYSSLVTPPSVFDYDMESRQRTLRKRTEVLLGYDPADYVCERLHATARDGSEIPISLVYRRDQKRPDGNPALLCGYGSYGINHEARFNSQRVSLLNRGLVVALAHIRGGGELGRRWYKAGKFLDKQNTFNDFIDCAEHLISQQVTDADRLAIMGGSAGGLLLGAVLNQRPDLFHAAVAQVPFVDVVTTMLDETLPLTVVEYEEWGNPNEERFYHAMKRYAPYDNVAEQEYPHLLITAGLNDPRVGFFEPAKWCARLRDRKTDDNMLLLKTNMGAGHAGASGRYDYLKELSLEYAFLIDRLRE